MRRKDITGKLIWYSMSGFAILHTAVLFATQKPALKPPQTIRYDNSRSTTSDAKSTCDFYRDPETERNLGRTKTLEGLVRNGC